MHKQTASHLDVKCVQSTCTRCKVDSERRTLVLFFEERTESKVELQKGKPSHLTPGIKIKEKYCGIINK